MARRVLNRLGRRAGFSLVELIAVIAVLALMVPTALSMLESAARQRTGASKALVATSFAASIGEHIIADMHAGDPAIGFEALDDMNAYLNDPNTGLRTRLAWLIGHHATLGYELDIEIGALMSADGTATGDPDLDLFRRLTVVVSWSDPGDGAQSFRLALVVGREEA
ncbi:MAG: type II secretion system protein [Phycisphaerales bacterium]